MKPRSRLLWACAVVFVLALLVRAPAATVYGWFGPAPGTPAPLRLVGVEGSLLNGAAAGLLVKGRTLAAPLNWTLHPLALLIGRISADLDTRGDLTATGRIALLPGGLNVHQLRAGGELRMLALAVRQPLPLTGQLALDLSELKIRDGVPTHAQGRVMVGNLAWALGAKPVPLGDFQAEVAPEGEELVAILSSLSGPLELSGNARLRPDRSYLLDIRIKAKPGTDPALGGLLSGLGRPDPQGYYSLRRNGQLPGAAEPGSSEEDVPADEVVTEDEDA